MSPFILVSLFVKKLYLTEGVVSSFSSSCISCRRRRSFWQFVVMLNENTMSSRHHQKLFPSFSGASRSSCTPATSEVVVYVHNSKLFRNCHFLSQRTMGLWFLNPHAYVWHERVKPLYFISLRFGIFHLGNGFKVTNGWMAKDPISPPHFPPRTRKKLSLFTSRSTTKPEKNCIKGGFQHATICDEVWDEVNFPTCIAVPGAAAARAGALLEPDGGAPLAPDRPRLQVRTPIYLDSVRIL